MMRTKSTPVRVVSEYVDGVPGIWELHSCGSVYFSEWIFLHFDADLPAEMEYAIRSLAPSDATEIPEVVQFAPRRLGVEHETILVYVRVIPE